MQARYRMIDDWQQTGLILLAPLIQVSKQFFFLSEFAQI
jgi:hypothetical protein